jgi:hypothetical protein
VTAGNSSPITDGAGALVLMSYRRAQQLGAPVMAVVRGWGDAQQEPEWFTTAPAKAVPKVGGLGAFSWGRCPHRAGRAGTVLPARAGPGPVHPLP